MIELAGARRRSPDWRANIAFEGGWCRGATRNRRPVDRSGHLQIQIGMGITDLDPSRRKYGSRVHKKFIRTVSPFQRLFAHRLARHRAMAMPPDTTAVTVGSAHCGGKWDECEHKSTRTVAIMRMVDLRL